MTILFLKGASALHKKGPMGWILLKIKFYYLDITILNFSFGQVFLSYLFVLGNGIYGVNT